MDGIYTKSPNPYSDRIREKDSQREEPDYKQGELLEGVVTAVGEKISINFSGKELSFPKEAVPNAKEGEKRTYQIMEASGTAFVLKEIGKKDSNTPQRKMQFTKLSTVDVGISVMAQSFLDVPSFEKEGEELETLSDRISERDAEELEEEGMTLEKYNLERLLRAIEQMKLQFELKQQALEGQIENKQEARIATEEIAQKAKLKEYSRFGLSEQMAKALSQKNLPLTKNNVKSLSDAMTLAKEAAHMTDASFSYLLEQNLEPTIENCYLASHATDKPIRPMSDMDFSKLDKAVQDVIKRANNRSKNEQGEEWTATREDARWLLERDLPLTEENLVNKKELEALRDDLKTERITQEEVLEGTVKTLYQKKDPKQTNLLTLRKKEENRLQMTEKAKDRMQQLGVEADLETIKERIEELKKEEIEYWHRELGTTGKNLEEAKTLFDQTEEAVQKLRKADVRILAESFSIKRDITLRGLSHLADSQPVAAKDGRSVLPRGDIEKTYEALMTAPRKDLGDSMNKAFQNVESQLLLLGMENTGANQRAVRILGYNSIPLTKENINEMKYYDAKVQNLIEKLRPSVTVELIRKGINPLDESIDVVEKAADEIARNGEKTPEMRYGEYLVKLERKQELSKEERDGYIGIYRMLYQIEKTDGAAIGALVQSGRELTLGNLLTESRGLKRRGLDLKADDQTGEAEKVREGRTINEQIETAYQTRKLREVESKLTPDRLEQMIQENSLFEDRFGRNRREEILTEDLSLSSKEDTKTREILDLSLEEMAEILEEIPKGETDRIEQSERLDQMRELMQNSRDEIRFLRRFESENSIEGLQATKDFLQGQNPYRKLRLRSNLPLFTISKVAKAMESQEELTKAIEGLQATAKDRMENLYLSSDLDAKQAIELSRMQNLLELSSRLVKKEYYDIPIETEEGISGIRLTVIHDSDSAGRMQIQLRSRKSEDIDETSILVRGSIQKGSLSLEIQSKDRGTLEMVNKETKRLQERFEDAGIPCKGIHSILGIYFDRDEGHSIGKETDQASIDLDEEGTKEPQAFEKTQLLYRAAKEIVLQLTKAMEGTFDLSGREMLS